MSVLSGLLVGTRIVGMLVTFPIFGGRNYPMIAKISFALFLTILVAPLTRINLAIDLSNGFLYGMYLLSELVLGLFLGYIVTIAIGFIYFAGDIIDYLIGFSMVSVMNPLDETQMPVTSNLLYVYLNFVFLSLGMHHRLILAMVQSFERIQVGAFLQSAESLSYMMKILSETLLAGLSIASPFIITILVADVVLGLLSKAMPGMNIFVLGMPFKILIGVFMLLLVVPILYEVLGDRIASAIDFMIEYMRTVG